jgi:glycosyltransferase involved in cell wall biosynthesis
MQPISVTILAKNAAQTLEATLDSLKRFPEVLLLDTGSVDGTQEIAKKYPNVRLIEEPFQGGFGRMHNLASALASHDWILSLDSDEILAPDLVDEILALQLDAGAVYQFNRCNYFQGKWIKCCAGWHPDPIIRLYHRKATGFTDAAVHEKVIADHLKVISLEGKCLHTPYRSIEDFLFKMQLYSTLFAEQNKGKSSSLSKAIFHGMAAFFKNYILKRGFLGGKEGLILSLYNAHTTYYKYLKLAFPKANQAGDSPY